MSNYIYRRPREKFEVLKVYNPSNIPGKSVLVLSIHMDANAATPSHTHGGAAAIAMVIDGTVLNQMNCDEPIVSKKGDFWYEAPGCHHVRSENTSGSETAKFLAILIVDDEVIQDGFENIFVLDAEKEENRG
jgi:quercetin dioxygenase-like cupin family protein